MEPMEEVPLEGLGESELERLVRGWRREAGSWFQRRGEAYWKERSVIRREDDVDGRASVTRDEERVLRGGWTVMRLCRWRLGSCKLHIDIDIDITIQTRKWYRGPIILQDYGLTNSGQTSDLN